MIHIENLVTEVPPLKNSNKESNIITKSIPNDEYKCQVRLSGLPEKSDPKSITCDLQDRTQINEVIEKLDSTAVIKNSPRVGKKLKQGLQRFWLR